MSVGIESLFTSALGLVPPWEVDKVELDTARRRIDFEVRCSGGCPGFCVNGLSFKPATADLRIQ